MILHLMPRDKFTYDHILFLNRHFSGEFVHFLYGKSKEGFVFPQCDNVYTLSCFTLLRFLISAVKSNAILIDWVVWQPLLLTYIWRRKSSLLYWGGDLKAITSALCPASRARLTFKDRLIAEYIDVCRGHVVLSANERDSLISVLHPRGTVVIGFIWVSLGELDEDPVETAGNQEDETIVMVGNSAAKTNRHHEVFELLKKYRGNTFKLLLPLSYGDKEYCDCVINDAVKEFGNRDVIPLVDFIPQKEYRELLRRIQIGIFDCTRQQALGNIRQLLYLGKKVFVSTDSGLYDQLTKEGYFVYPVEAIPMLSFEQFLSYPDQMRDKNMATARSKEVEFADQWREIIRYLY